MEVRGWTNHNILECGGDIEGTEGSIQSPGYPNSFAHRHSCTWRIRAPLGRKVTLTFLDLDLEPPVTFRNRTTCRYDWLMVSIASIIQFIKNYFETMEDNSYKVEHF